jgi:hypothetical protein
MDTAPPVPRNKVETLVEETPLGLTRTASHVYTWSDGRAIYTPLPSVTTILRVIDKSGPLLGWARRTTAACAVRNLDALIAMREEGGPDAAITWLKSVPDHIRDAAANRGTQVHLLAERIVRGEEPEVPEELAGHLNAYRRFLHEWNPAFIAVEQMVCSLRFGFAGGFDAIADIAGERWLLDIKTGGVYAEAALQISAYAAAQFIGRAGDPRKYRLPRVSRYGIVHVQADRAELVPVAVDQSTFATFLRALELWRWTQGPAKTVIGKPITKEGYAA